MTVQTENVSYSRQWEILDPEAAAETHVTVIGCGTVGSNAAMQLARAGFKQFHLIDFDAVEGHNLPSQAFAIEHLGVNKALALASEMDRVTDNLSISVQEYGVDGGEMFTPGIVVCAVDSMKFRKLIFELSAKNNPNISLFIDVRMGGNTMKTYSFDPCDEKRIGQYEKTLYSQEEAAPIECGGRTFAPVGALAGAFITQMVTKHIRENDAPPYHMEMEFDQFDLVVMGRFKGDESE